MQCLFQTDVGVDDRKLILGAYFRGSKSYCCNYEGCQKVMRKLSGQRVPTNFCQGCSSAKSKRLRYRTRKHCTDPLQTLHGDLNGPHEYSIECFRYFSVLIDEATRFLFIGLHRTKDEVARHIMEQLTLSQRQLGFVFKRLHYDNGSEALTNEVLEYARSTGISVSTSPV